MNKRFALIGAGGYVAPRHMKAIQETQNLLVAALDRHDSVGIMDAYFPAADFFTEFERFDRHLYKQRSRGIGIEYLSVCSPNYLHDAHIRFGLRLGSDVICEKPLVLNPWNIDALREMEDETGKKVYNILQLRVHPKVIELRNSLMNAPTGKKHEVDLVYITSRGKWYHTSWKGDISKSGGIATNIGVHFYDLLGWLFGKVLQNIVHLHEADRVAGYLEYEQARVRYFLSIDEHTLPEAVRASGKRTYRRMEIDGSEFEFSEGFTDLHTVSYREILEGRGFGLEEARACIQTVHDIRNMKPIGLKGDVHPLATTG
ncbi:MAG: Gfo/Idh/MocA family oxidoreductase [Saprospiraceae bacterium]|jgi:UDP-N-acetyl-2-amino-2-deoxyglucuronate dehydrogenase|nr:Gfo/Idh/MocA family oxidoreductase [Saprospiraceae bacterium]MBP9210555.1 Gfo/Idh/MocA family oxidoreductase [Saprospiraceae bacterium]MBV6473303.1 UDP-N-acetyl-2-amino-2-deoxy-D-glucuronate oxidase [Saprospiraceae bacterium]